MSERFEFHFLCSETKQRYYAGQTQDVEKRLMRHNKGLVRSTKSGMPWKVVKVFETENRSEALKLEKKIKKRGIKRFLDDHQYGV